MLFLKGDDNNVRVYTTTDSVPPRSSGSDNLTYFENILPWQFLRVNRSYIVNKTKVYARRGDKLIIKDMKSDKGEHEIPIGNTFTDSVNKDEWLGQFNKGREQND